ncbi:MAG: iron dependent repressor, metal binding and dimerization domain protein, partial [Pseudomonadota bacterium]
GLYLCVWLDSSGGGAVMLFCTFQFLVVLLIAPRYGLSARWMRLRRMVPQQLVEDILASAVRARGRALSMSEMAESLKNHYDVRVEKAVKSMARDGLLKMERGSVSLTDEGRNEATRILRAHRLWETYLQHVGTPEDQIHSTAHRLEHVHDRDAVDYLDDLLGHPEKDPHGAEIPLDREACRPGATCSISSMREGMKAVVRTLGTGGRCAELNHGEEITIGPRGEDGETWNIIRGNGSGVVLDHPAADSVKADVVEVP